MRRLSPKQRKQIEELQTLMAIQEAQQHRLHLKALAIADEIAQLQDQVIKSRPNTLDQMRMAICPFANINQTTIDDQITDAKIRLHMVVAELHGPNYGYDSNITSRYGMSCWLDGLEEET